MTGKRFIRRSHLFTMASWVEGGSHCVAYLWIECIHFGITANQIAYSFNTIMTVSSSLRSFETFHQIRMVDWIYMNDLWKSVAILLQTLNAAGEYICHLDSTWTVLSTKPSATFLRFCFFNRWITMPGEIQKSITSSVFSKAKEKRYVDLK